MSSLKKVRKEARERFQEYHSRYWWHYICYKKSLSFYLSEYMDGYEVFYINKDGSLRIIGNTNYSKNFHREAKKRREKRISNNK